MSTPGCWGYPTCHRVVLRQPPFERTVSERTRNLAWHRLWLQIPCRCSFLQPHVLAFRCAVPLPLAGHPYSPSTSLRPLRGTVSKAFEKSLKTVYSGIFCTIHFSCNWCRQKVTSVVPGPPLWKPHWVSGETLGVMCSLNFAKNKRHP